VPYHGPPPPRPPNTPEEVVITWEAAERILPEKANLGIDLPRAPNTTGTPRHRLVTIGDSLTHGFKNFAISDTEHSWPAIVAYELGWLEHFRRPEYEGPAVCKGLPLNLYDLVARMEAAAHGKKHIIGWARMVWSLLSTMLEVKRYWQSGPGSKTPVNGPFNHNLAIYGWDLRDAMSKDVEWCDDSIRGRHRRVRAARKRPRRKRGNPIKTFLLWLGAKALGRLVISHPNEIAARMVLWGDGNPKNTQLIAAKALGDEGTEESKTGESDGIETLVVALGSNNALKTVVYLNLAWSKDGMFKDLDAKDQYTIWRPTHFKEELDELVTRVREIHARHVIWSSIPHVTIVPLAHGVGEKPYYSRYFPRYTYVVIPDSEFDGNVDPMISADEARTVDSVIDSYNAMIRVAVAQARSDSKDWYYFDACGLLDSMAYRRYLENPRPRPRPRGWKPYDFPNEFNSITPFPDTRFITSDHKGAMTGGLIGLDGVHPTTLLYGIVAQEIIKVMELAGVQFKHPDGSPRSGPVKVEWSRLIEAEPLVQKPLKTLGEILGVVGELMERIDLGRFLFS